MNQELIYLDNAATTKTDPEVLRKMMPYFSEYYGNASSIYPLGAKSKRAVEEGREEIAKTLGVNPSEIYFTAGGSEADNWALKAVIEAYGNKGHHIITSKIEHHAILNTCHYLEDNGFEITYLDVDENGIIDLEQLKQSIRPDTILISIMYANNEIGTIQPIHEIGQLAKEHNILFHTDAVQAYGQVPIDIEEDFIDLMSVSGHKFHGPKGIGFLYIRNNVKIRALIHGGQQERSRRAGTENVPAIVGIGAAAVKAYQRMEIKKKHEETLRDYFIKRVEEEIPFCRLNGDRKKRLPNNINFSFEFIEGESVLILLGQQGICASSGSACTSGSLDPSHVLLAIGLPHEKAHGSIRFTLSEETTKENLDFTVDELKKIVDRLRSMSPLYADYIKKK